MDLIRPRIGSDSIVFEMTITKERGGDGVLLVPAPMRKNGSRVVLADGIELHSGELVIAGSSYSNRTYTFDLVEDVPIRLDVVFEANIRDAVLCRRIEVAAKTGTYADEFVFRFDDVLVSAADPVIVAR